MPSAGNLFAIEHSDRAAQPCVLAERVLQSVAQLAHQCDLVQRVRSVQYDLVVECDALDAKQDAFYRDKYRLTRRTISMSS